MLLHCPSCSLRSGSLGGTLERALDYGPYGESLGTDWAATSAPAARKLFIGKEKLKSDDTELYDFGARRYDPALPRWTSVDPLAGKYPGISPYAYCAGNPVSRVDSNGKDIWEINNQGKIVNHLQDDTKDAFYMVDKKGNLIEGKEIVFEYGTIEKYQSQFYDEERKTFDWYIVRGDQNGTYLFEFFANNTSIEFSQLLLGQKGESGLNIISTSHEESCERAFRFLFDNQYKNGYFIRGHIHNHPSDSAFPSGLLDGTKDIAVSRHVTDHSINNGSGIPTFRIYLPGKNQYIEYNQNSSVYDFPDAVIKYNVLPELIITP